MIQYPELFGKIALVTGASRGIGRAIAIALAEAGCHVTVNYHRREKEAGEVCRKIEELGRRSAAIVIDDATRRLPTAAMLRPIVDQLRGAGIAAEAIAVVVATGLHRPMNDGEARRVLSGLPLRLVNHDPHDPAQLVDLGKTSRGTLLRVNRTVAEAEVRVLTGDVELHQFVGYGGGAKSVLPGVSDADGIRLTHAKMDSPGAGPGRGRSFYRARVAANGVEIVKSLGLVPQAFAPVTSRGSDPIDRGLDSRNQRAARTTGCRRSRRVPGARALRMGRLDRRRR